MKPDPNKHFFGKVCPRCQGRERFISDSGCIACARERVRTRRARARRTRGTPKTADDEVMKKPARFLGVECRRCGGRERYAADHSCVACKADQSRARRIAADKARKAAGTSQTYRGARCPRGHRLRFRATGKCVACDRAAYRARNQHRTPLAEVHKRARTPNRKKALAKGARY
jgi:hypothetical protein